MEHHLMKIRHKKCFFVKSFVVSVVIYLIVWAIATLIFNYMAAMNYQLYGLELEDYAEIFVAGMCLWKILIIQFTLIPIFAAMGVEKRIKKDMEK